MSNLITLDKEISVGDKVYYALVQADVEFRDSEDLEPCGVEINNAEISLLDGDLLPLAYEGRRIEKVIATGLPELTEAIDTALWDEIQSYTEDNYQDLMRDLRDAADERDL
jgi:hypothetical protein